MSQIEGSSPFLPLPEGIIILSTHAEACGVIVQLTCCLPSARCPLCAEASERIHGAYVRTVADLPALGRRVILNLSVRKFVCGTVTCPRKIFTERLPDLVQSYARMTNRLSETLQTLGFATCGELGERLAPKLGMQVSGPTLLRRMRTRSCPPPVSVCILGIDDWCWKKGMTYGTLLVDLELRKPIELLADRSVETAEAWLKAHPEIKVVSRDRGGDYAAAARKGAPQAQQVADRFHLLLNLRVKLKELMVRKHTLLPIVSVTPSDAIPEKARGRGALYLPPTPETKQLLPSLQTSENAALSEKAFALLDQTNRPARYEAVNQLWKKGKSIRFIAKHLSMSRVTVRRYLSAAPPPDSPAAPGRKTAAQVRRAARAEMVLHLWKQGNSERSIAHHLKFARKTVHRYLKDLSVFDPIPVPRRKSLLDPFKPYILARWEAGCRNGSRLYREVESYGYTGSASMFRRFISQLRKHQQAGGAVTEPSATSGETCALPGHPISPTRAAWLFVSPPEKLDQAQRALLQQIRNAHSDLERAYQLAQKFIALLKERAATDVVVAWLHQTEQCSIPELKSFALGIRRDYDAVFAAFSSPWSNGQVEAQVNCLKLQKRIVFGRANFDLLRLRVLCRV